jgi:predicted kinase
MNAKEFFAEFKAAIELTPHWAQMVATVENSPWHREANVAVHTEMTIDQYMNRFFPHRTERQRILTLMALLFHDFGKPEAEETLEKKDEPGVFYRRYAGHEPISGNEFLSFMYDNDSLREMFFAQGFSWRDVRTIKVMIEHHLPYGLKNEQKRQNLKQMVELTFGEDEEMFYDMLRSDGAGRISDDHETKLQNVEDWINEFQTVTWKPHPTPVGNARLLLLVGISGAGKSTYIEHLRKAGMEDMLVYNEDVLRLEYAHANMPYEDWAALEVLSEAERYQAAWNFCHLEKESKFEQFASAEFRSLLERGGDVTVIVDRMNQGRKARGKFIQAARQKKMKVQSIEFIISESKAKERQKTRGDKSLSDHRVHQIFMQLETPWLGSEIDSFKQLIA